MINEWEEYLAYTTQPVYLAEKKSDTRFLGRFTMEMLLEFYGLSRVFTILARGTLFHHADGSLRADDPYSRIEEARDALKAWCSIPSGHKKKQDWQFETDFRSLHDRFPALVDAEGRGWFYRHVHAVAQFMERSPDKVHKRLLGKAERIRKGFDAAWRDKVMQYQVPLFSPETKGGWIIRFDDVLADALELGPLRCTDVALPEETAARLLELCPKEVPAEVVLLLAKYYLANRRDDLLWIVLPVTNFEAFLGSTALSRMYLPKLPPELLERKEVGFGVSMYRMMI